ncbi:MAG: 1-acyl-sn-glycerol-3-phosphate acyltransferase [Clostridiales bacterium]|nr:1-acyl-sn-glycerol-3-phosphate acyltransferase [Clostridiales bacterium]
MKFYRIVYKLLSGFFRFLLRIEITGQENEPEQTGYLACANHISNWDVIILAVSLKRPVQFFAKAELFKIPLLKQLITALGAFPAERGAADLGALKNTISLLQKGDVVGFFPQGTRRPGTDPKNTAVKSGVAMIAHRSGCPVLPILIQTKNYKIRPFRKVFVSIGKPIEAAELAIDKNAKEQYAKASAFVFSHITDMEKEELS